MSEYGVIIARFQVPELHLGHAHLIREVLSRHDKCVILFGVAGMVSTNINPLSFYVRKRMVEQHFPSVEIDALYDIPDDNIAWSKSIDTILSKYDGEPILYGSRDSFLPFYRGKHKCQEIQPLWERSGTDIRNELVDVIHNT